MKKIAIMLLFLAGTAISAHEFWLEPQHFHLHKGETLTLKFLVGEDFNGENWKGNRSSVEKLQLFYNEIQDNLTQLIPDSLKGDSLNLQFFDEGTALIAYQSTNKSITLEPSKFLEYLKEDGLDNAIRYRDEHQETDSSGRELYQRCAKTIFQVGNKTDQSFGQVCGLPSEFIPLTNPYSLKAGDEMAVKILVEGKPADGLMIKTWHRVNGKTTKKDLLTDSNGVVRFPVSLTGKWMVSNVRMVRLESNATADWQSFWASLTWGY
jgi:uncharacterized GH25 family protein